MSSRKSGPDVVRFIMLYRKNEAPLDFDFKKVTEQSKDNPVFYVQYAHARICSVFRNAAEEGIKPGERDLQTPDSRLLTDAAELPSSSAASPSIRESSSPPPRLTSRTGLPSISMIWLAIFTPLEQGQRVAAIAIYLAGRYKSYKRTARFIARYSLCSGQRPSNPRRKARRRNVDAESGDMDQNSPKNHPDGLKASWRNKLGITEKLPKIADEFHPSSGDAATSQEPREAPPSPRRSRDPAHRSADRRRWPRGLRQPRRPWISASASASSARPPSAWQSSASPKRRSAPRRSGMPRRRDFFRPLPRTCRSRGSRLPTKS